MLLIKKVKKCMHSIIVAGVCGVTATYVCFIALYSICLEHFFIQINVYFIAIKMHADMPIGFHV
jgi:hypothetical protein